MTTNGHLRYQLHISDPVPFSHPDRAPNGERQMFQYIATTLISGERDAVLVDPPMTTEQTARVIKWIEASGRTLKHVFITHGHGDHWFGTGPLLARFPTSRSSPRRARSTPCAITPRRRYAQAFGTSSSQIKFQRLLW
jgi:glyoxylase-like metal-dependent hydrolase (beta-lactamase superfamily II)